MIPILADASNDFTGQWFYVAAAAVGLVIGIIGILSYFATRREVDEIKEQLKEQDKKAEEIATAQLKNAADTAKQIEDSYRRLDRSDEARISGIHNRLNPLETTTANLQGQMTAFTVSFEKFTRIIESTSKAREDQTTAFIRALDTFANVLSDKDKK